MFVGVASATPFRRVFGGTNGRWPEGKSDAADVRWYTRWNGRERLLLMVRNAGLTSSVRDTRNGEGAAATAD